MRLEAQRLSFAYPHAEPVLHEVSLAVATGERVALIGPNGSGKSTLLALLAGLLAPGAGSVLLDGRPLPAWPGRERARRVARVATLPPDADTYTVQALVELARTPYASFLGRLTSADREAVAEALARCSLETLARRPLSALSEGERQRVVLAMALAQEAPLILLDEPTAHLDLAHALAFLERLRALTETDGRGLLMVLHDLDWAAAFAERIVMLQHGRIVAEGTPEAVLTPERVAAVFGVRGILRKENERLRWRLEL